MPTTCFVILSKEKCPICVIGPEAPENEVAAWCKKRGYGYVIVDLLTTGKIK
jgi:F420-dependent methylenetetrahydromethanopterin dehydrogenase